MKFTEQDVINAYLAGQQDLVKYFNPNDPNISEAQNYLNEIKNNKSMSTVVDVARGEIGTEEKPRYSNKTKYGEWFGWDGVAWCGMFVSWVYAHANKQLPNIGFTKGFAGCQTAVAYFKKRNEIVNSPISGDIVFFDWNKDKRYDHTGIFVKDIDGKTFLSIEGNTSLKNQSNGGQVMQRTRKYSQSIFARPK